MNRRNFFHRAVAIVAAVFGYPKAVEPPPVVLDPQAAILRDLYCPSLQKQIKNDAVYRALTNSQAARQFEWRLHQ